MWFLIFLMLDHHLFNGFFRLMKNKSSSHRANGFLICWNQVIQTYITPDTNNAKVISMDFLSSMCLFIHCVDTYHSQRLFFCIPDTSPFQNWRWVIHLFRLCGWYQFNAPQLLIYTFWRRHQVIKCWFSNSYQYLLWLFLFPVKITGLPSL